MLQQISMCLEYLKRNVKTFCIHIKISNIVNLCCDPSYNARFFVNQYDFDIHIYVYAGYTTVNFN